MNIFKYIIKTLIVVYIFSITNNLFAQEKKKQKTDTLYIEDYSRKLTVFTYGKTKYVKVFFRNKTNNKEIGFSPNNNFNIGFGFTYKWLGLGIAFNLPFVNHDNKEKGRTDRFDAQMNVLSQKFVYDLYFSHYKGFYVTTPRIIAPFWNESMPYPQYPELVSNNLGVSAYYILNNKKFSYKAGFALNQLQLKSAGSWIFGFVAKFNSVKNDTALIPESIWNNDSVNFKVKSINDLSIGPLAGYAYNFVIKKHLLLTISLVPGILIENSTYTYYLKDEILTDHSSSLGIGINYRMGIIYNKNRFFTGFNLNNFATSYEIKNVAKTSSTGNYRVFVGYRFY